MTDKRIIDLESIDDIQGADLLAVFDESASNTKKITLTDFYNKTNFFGWANYSDNQYSEAIPLAIASDTRTLITNNTGGSGTNETYMNEEFSLWQNDAIHPNNVGDAFTVRVNFSIAPATNNTDITLEVDIGEVGVSSIPIFSASQRLIRGAGVESFVSFVIPLFALDAFVANKGRIYLTTSENCDLWNCAIYIVKDARSVTV